MSNKDYEIKNLTKIITTIWNYQTELTCDEIEARVEEARENNKMLEFHSLITEMTFGNRINTCKELIKIDLRAVQILAYQASYDIAPKLNEREELERLEKRNEKQEARLKKLQENKDQHVRITELEKTVSELESDKKEKELEYQKIDLEEEIEELNEKLAK